VPVLVGEHGVVYKTTSTYAAQECIPKELLVKRHQIDLAFAVRPAYSLCGMPLLCLLLKVPSLLLEVLMAMS